MILIIIFVVLPVVAVLIYWIYHASKIPGKDKTVRITKIILIVLFSAILIVVILYWALFFLLTSLLSH